MDKRRVTLAVLVTIIAVLPLGVVLFLVLPRQPDADLGYLLWAFFSVAVAGAISLVVRGFAPALTSSGASDQARLIRIGRIAFFVVFASFLPLWLTVFAAPAGWSVAARALVTVLSPIVLIVMARAISLPMYWNLYRAKAEEAGQDFIGSELDEQMRPEYYDEDVRWLAAAVHERLTSASGGRR